MSPGACKLFHLPFSAVCEQYARALRQWDLARPPLTWAEACQVASASDLAAHVLGRHTVSRFVDFFFAQESVVGHFEKGSEKKLKLYFFNYL